MTTVLNLGWGVQSFTMAAMVGVGELPPVDLVIHADTTHEKQETYEFIKRWTPWLKEHGLTIVTVTGKTTAILEKEKEIQLPAFTLSKSTKGGQLRRQCTDKWKIRPIRKYLRQNTTGVVTMWLGISMDEVQRMRKTDVKWIKNHYPLVEIRMSRAGCVHWLQKNGLEVPPKSACLFCPYQNKNSWRDLKYLSPTDFEKAVLVDQTIRDKRPPYDLFIHPARKPLTDVDLRTRKDFGQMEFDLENDECTGNCFL